MSSHADWLHLKVKLSLHHKAGSISQPHKIVMEMCCHISILEGLVHLVRHHALFHQLPKTYGYHNTCKHQ